MKALMLILHGSPRPESSDPARRLLESIKASGKFDFAILAFMECEEPTITDAVAQCAERGVRRIIAVPYMLHSGRHLVLDIPRILVEAASKVRGLEVLISDPVGQFAATTFALLERAEETGKNIAG